MVFRRIERPDLAARIRKCVESRQASGTGRPPHDKPAIAPPAWHLAAPASSLLALRAMPRTTDGERRAAECKRAFNVVAEWAGARAFGRLGGRSPARGGLPLVCDARVPFAPTSSPRGLRPWSARYACSVVAACDSSRGRRPWVLKHKLPASP